MKDEHVCLQSAKDASINLMAHQKHLVGAASRDEDGLVSVLLKVPRLDAVLLLQHCPVLGSQEEVLQRVTKNSSDIA